jgi:hypothetical protein
MQPPNWTEEVNLLFGQFSRGEPHLNLMSGARWGLSHEATIIRAQNAAGARRWERYQYSSDACF